MVFDKKNSVSSFYELNMNLKIDDALKKGIEAHKAGKIHEADQYYTAILKAQPNHPDANHNMGVLALGIGRVTEAITFFKKALEQNSRVDQFWISYIEALINSNMLSEARRAFNAAKKNKIESLSFIKLEEKFSKINKNVQISDTYKTEDPPEKIIVSILNFYKNKKYKEALIFSEEKLNLYPNSSKLFLLIGSLYNELKQFENAINSYKKALKIKPDYAEVYNHMALTFRSMGDLEQSIETIKKALKIRPNYLEALLNLAISQNEFGHIDKAINNYKKVIKIKPNYAEAYNNLGIALKDSNKNKEAIKKFKEALKIDPNYAEAYNNLGISLYENDLSEEAIVNFKKAIKIKKNYAAAYNNLGIVLKYKGLNEDAIHSYRKALEFYPNYPQAYNNLGIALFHDGKVLESINSYKQALKYKPDYIQVYFNLGTAISGISLKKPDSELLNLIEKLLDYKTLVRPKEIVKTTISLLKFDPVIITSIKRLSEGKLSLFLEETIFRLSKIKILLKLMSVCPIPDLDFEALFKSIRSAILFSIKEIKRDTKLINFQKALALQCYTNEYIYEKTEQEKNLIKKLEKSVQEQLLKGENPNPVSILCLASYKALSDYSWNHLITFYDEIEEVRIRQILEPTSEEKLKSKIPRLNSISDEVSFKVKEQYEKNPYPRWINSALALNPKPFSSIAKEYGLKIFNSDILKVKEPKILIAGCGTGQHSIETASKFKGSKILAIDLSLSSLSYAKRKTLELNLDNIDYMQADILDLSKLGKKFDIIECGGVLHHMNDPMAGWRVLTNCLKKGGFMRIALYSELGRANLIKILDEIKSSVKDSSKTNMKFFRKKIIKSNEEHHKWIRLSDDFFSLSTLKDLLFHVQEHRFTLPQIKECLLDLGLKFCGFDEIKKRNQFKLVYPNYNDLYDLDKWDLFEKKDQFIFANMYQFWCQKL